MSGPSDESLWWSVERTLRDVVLPRLEDASAGSDAGEWARVATIQLVGLAQYARTRPADETAARRAKLATALDTLAATGNVLVAHQWPSANSVEAATASILASAIEHDSPDAAAAQAALRPIVVRHLDEDLAASMVLMGPFRGQLPEEQARS